MLDNNKGEHAVRDLGNSEDTGGGGTFRFGIVNIMFFIFGSAWTVRTVCAMPEGGNLIIL